MNHHGDLLRALPRSPLFASSDEPTAAKATKPTPSSGSSSSTAHPNARGEASQPPPTPLAPASSSPFHTGDTSIVPNPTLRPPNALLSSNPSIPSEDALEDAQSAQNASRRLFLFRDKQQDGKRHTGEFSMEDVSSWMGRQPPIPPKPAPSIAAKPSAYDFDEASEGTTPPPAIFHSPDRLIGQQLGNFRILSCIGRGGFATVYKAEQLYLQQPFAIKVLHIDQKEQPDVLERFRREAQALAQLRHPHVVQISDFGLLPDVGFYLVMEFLEGQDLSKRFQQEAPFSIERVAKIMEQLCSVLDYIHRKGVIHRDLKPANIFLVQDLVWGEQVKLIDFGVASLMQSAGLLTQQGAYLGTARYVSPEQAEGAKDVDGRSDLYALGIILHWMLCGKHPFDGENPIGILYQQIHKSPPLLAEQAPQKMWSPLLEEVLKKCLAKDRTQRPQSASAFWELCKPALLSQEQHQNSADSFLETQAVPVQRPTFPFKADEQLRTLRNFSPLPDPLQAPVNVQSPHDALQDSPPKPSLDSTFSSSIRSYQETHSIKQEDSDAQLDGTLSTTQDEHASSLFSLHPNERTTKRASLRQEKKATSHRDEEDAEEGDSTLLEPLMIYSPSISTPVTRILRREEAEPATTDAARTHVGPFPKQDLPIKPILSDVLAFDGVDATLVQASKRAAPPTQENPLASRLSRTSALLLAGCGGIAAFLVLWWIAGLLLSKPTPHNTKSFLRVPSISYSLPSGTTSCPVGTLLLPSSFQKANPLCIESNATTIPKGTPNPYAFAEGTCSRKQLQLCSLSVWKEACSHRKSAEGALCNKLRKSSAKKETLMTTLCAFSSYVLPLGTYEVLMNRQKKSGAFHTPDGICQEATLTPSSASLFFRCCSPLPSQRINP